ncbi:hypothetical protein ABIB56_003066 [Glaciihabitans sp. UYNi722]
MICPVDEDEIAFHAELLCTVTKPFGVAVVDDAVGGPVHQKESGSLLAEDVVWTYPCKHLLCQLIHGHPREEGEALIVAEF